QPRSVHPEGADSETPKDWDQAAGVIVVGVRHDHVLNDDIAAVVLLDMLNHLLADLAVSAIDDVQVVASRVSVLHKDRVPVAVADGQELHCDRHGGFAPPYEGSFVHTNETRKRKIW